MTDKTKRAGEKDGMETALSEYRLKLVNPHIKMRDLVALENGFRRGYAAGRASRDGLMKALERIRDAHYECLISERCNEKKQFCIPCVTRFAIAQDNAE